MFQRFLVTASFGCAAMLGPMFLSAPAIAQDQTYFTYVSQWAAPRAEWANFEKQEKEDDATMQKLVADGTIIAWGDATVRVHEESGYSHVNWFTATSRSNLLKALEVLSGSASSSPALVATTKHSDLLLRTLAHGGKAASGATGYLRVAFYQAKPGAGDALEAHFKSVLIPKLDQAISNGTLLMYNFDKQDIHTEAPGGYNLALLFPEGGAIDKFYADLAAWEKQDPGIFEISDNLVVEKEHRDFFSRVTAYQHK